jgi:hypothetical protein
VTHEKPDHTEPEWPGKSFDLDSDRSYQPVVGPDEPSQPPLGRGSASVPAAEKPQIEAESAPDSGQDG